MNLIHSIINRQEGYTLCQDYDVALYRLKCLRKDVFRCITPSTMTQDYNPTAPIFTTRFCTTKGYEHLLALANEDGKIAIQDTESQIKRNKFLDVFQAHFNAVFDVAWMPHELQLVTASGDHSVALWDVNTPTITKLQTFQGHTRSVKTAVFRHDDKAVFASGARDGAIMLWDIRASHGDQARPDNCIMNAHSIANATKSKKSSSSARAQSITGLAFQDDFTLLSCAAGDGHIKAWDLRKNYMVHKKDPVAKHILNHTGRSTRSGFSSLLMCPSKITLYASCMDNIIYAYNISSFNSKPFAEFYGHQNSTFYVKACLSPDGRYLGSGSSDESAYIWHTRRPGSPLIKLTGHSEEVTCIAWCSVGETKIVTSSDDFTHRIWRVSYEYEIDNEEVEVQGKAIIVPILNCRTPPMNLNLESTPSTRGNTSRMDRTPSDVTPGPSSRDSVSSSSACFSSTSAKRTHDQMSKTILSPIHENRDSKRPHLEIRGARRLFSPMDKSSVLNVGYESDEAGSSSSINNNDPSKMLFSPTSNLPNFVIDGTAPHLLEMSPQKYKENVDWLTKIRKERLEQKLLEANTEKSKKKHKSQITPNRRRSSSIEPKSPASSLLHFFKVQPSKDGQQSSPQSPGPTTSKDTPEKP